MNRNRLRKTLKAKRATMMRRMKLKKNKAIQKKSLK